MIRVCLHELLIHILKVCKPGTSISFSKCVLSASSVTQTVSHSVPTAFMNAVGTEWVTPGLSRICTVCSNMRFGVHVHSLANAFITHIVDDGSDQSEI